MNRLALADGFDFRLLPLARPGERLMLIEGVMHDWQELREQAARSSFAAASPRGYPGIRASLPGAYVRALLRRIDPAIRQAFFAGRAMKLARFDCNFSLVTRPPAALHPLQKLPHVDFASADRIALLHYLCEAHFGGTAFFRQTATGFDSVGPEERADWAAAREQELALLGPQHGYPGANTPGYVQTMAFAAKPDRLIAYRSNMLHSGVIDRPRLLSEDPRSGRLTANFFLDYVPADAR